MIIDFISQLPRFSSRLKVTSVHNVLPVLYMLLFIPAVVNAQVSTTSLANYKRPHDIGKTKNISGNDQQFIIITKKTQDRLSVKSGRTWRYHSTPAQLVVDIDSKTNTDKKIIGIRSNYKAQH